MYSADIPGCTTAKVRQKTRTRTPGRQINRPFFYMPLILPLVEHLNAFRVLAEIDRGMLAGTSSLRIFPIDEGGNCRASGHRIGFAGGELADFLSFPPFCGVRRVQRLPDEFDAFRVALAVDVGLFLVAGENPENMGETSAVMRLMPAAAGRGAVIGSNGVSVAGVSAHMHLAVASRIGKDVGKCRFLRSAGADGAGSIHPQPGLQCLDPLEHPVIRIWCHAVARFLVKPQTLQTGLNRRDVGFFDRDIPSHPS